VCLLSGSQLLLPQIPLSLELFLSADTVFPGPGWCGSCRLLSHRICRMTHVQWHRVPYEYRKVKPNSSVLRFLRVRNESFQTSTVMASYRPLCPSNPVLTTRKALNLFCGKMRWCFIASKRCLTRFRDKNWTVIYTPLDTDIHLCAHFRE